MTHYSPMIWIAFNTGVIALLFLDAFILNPKGREISLRRALLMTAFWLLLAMLFNLGVYYYLGNQKALEFLASYVVEQSLSVDNLFVFLLIFSHFKVSPAHQQKILLWGIISAQVMRAGFILGALALLNSFSWMTYIFGAILLFTGIKLFFQNDQEVHPEDNPLFKFIGKRVSLFWLVFVMIQVTDVIFAVDSIPAVLAITKDPFIAYTSNIFAILGLRAMYFALASFMKLFHHLHYGLAIILCFIGFKMLTEHFWHLPVLVTLGFIIVTLMITVITSILCAPKNGKS